MGTVNHQLPSAKYPKLAKWFNTLLEQSPIRANFDRADAHIKRHKYYDCLMTGN